MKERLRAKFPGFHVMEGDEPAPADKPQRLIHVQRKAERIGSKNRAVTVTQVTVRDGEDHVERAAYGDDVEAEVEAAMAVLLAPKR